MPPFVVLASSLLVLTPHYITCEGGWTKRRWYVIGVKEKLQTDLADPLEFSTSATEPKLKSLK